MKKRLMNVLLFPGTWASFKKGKYAPGLDLNRHIRDVLRSCGYPCLTCDEPNCTEKDILNPNIRDLVEDLQAQIDTLQAQVDALS